jgi:hypothetical protein
VAEADEEVVDTVEVAVADTVDPVPTLTVVVAVVVSRAECRCVRLLLLILISSRLHSRSKGYGGSRW